MVFERRENPRFDCLNPSECLVELEGEPGTVRMINFSRKGLSLESSKYFRRNEDSKFNIRLSGLAGKITNIPCEVRVVWVKPRPNEVGCICGARIIRMDSAQKSDILDVLYENWKRKMLDFTSDEN